MAALQAGGLHVPCISSARFPQKSRQERLVCSCSYSDHTAFNPLKTPSFSRVVLRPHRNGHLLFCSRTRNRTRSFQSISFQDVAENDSDGNEPSVSSSTPTLDRQGERVWQKLQGNLQVWGKNGTMQIARQFLAIRKKNAADAKPNLAPNLARVKFATLWSSVDPSIKWPVAIFLPLYLVVTAAFGSAVSKELWPLWTIWPLATSFYIRAGAQAAVKIRQLLLVLLQRSREALAAVQSDEVQQKMSARIEFVKSMPDAAKLYLRRNAASDLKKGLVFLATWLVERYEDLIDLLWPSWRVLWRQLVNLF